MNIPTQHAVNGEVCNVLKTFHLPYSKMYARSYDAVFLKAVVDELRERLPMYQVEMTIGDDYLLEIRQFEVDA